MLRLTSFLVLATACNVPLAADSADPAERASTGSCLPLGGTYSGVTFTDEQAHNAIDFADNATQAELEAMLGIGPSIGGRIVSARPFGTHDDPMAALDAVTYVGPMLLGRFRDDTYSLWCGIDDGRQGCCIDLSCDGLGGTFSGVEISDGDAQMVLDWANRASYDELDAVCGVGDTVASGIIAARPLHAVTELDAVSYVGPTLLHRMVGDEGYVCTTRDTVADAWCDQDGACVCDADETLVLGGDTAADIEHTDLSELPTAIAAAVEALAARTDWCDPEHTWSPTVDLVVEHQVSGAVTGYTVTLEQWGEDFEVGWAITVDLDAAGAELGSACEGL